jgi:arginine-tRNA-protein transferase
MAKTRAFLADSIPPEIYHDFMDANFRRSGKYVYQPACAGCRACQSIRVPVDRFRMNKSQRRCWRRNQDLSVTFAKPQLTDEKIALYARYQRDWHSKPETPQEELAEFLYDSPVNTLEFEYRTPDQQLLAVGICDVCSRSLSSVYFYFDPRFADRSLGTYGVLREIEEATKLAIPFLYLGYWVRQCGAMEYKSSFKPCEILHTDGVWREDGDNPSTNSDA